MSDKTSDIISTVFAFSLNKNLPNGWKKLMTNFQSSQVYVLSDCDLTPETIDFSNIDSALMERLAIYAPLDKNNIIFKTQDHEDTDKHIWFLFRCYERASYIASSCSTENLEAYNRCKEICVTFSESMISEPEAFSIENAPEFVFKLISCEYAKPIFSSFIKDLMKNSDNLTQKKNFFLAVVSYCMKLLSNEDIKVTDEVYLESVHMLSLYVDVPQLCECLLNSQLWIPPPGIKMNGAKLENSTILGLILRATSIQKMEEPSLFNGVMDHSEASGTVAFLQTFIKSLCNPLVEIFKNIFRNVQLRNRLYAWLILAVRTNRDHAKLGARYYEEVKENLSSPGFFLNLTYITLRLLHPVIRVWGSKFDKINFKLLERSCIVQYDGFRFETFDFSGETKLLPSESSTQNPELCDIHDFNFMTILYFFTPWLISIALVPLWEEYRKVMIILHENRPENPFSSIDDPESQQFQTLLRWQLAFKTHICLPDLVEMLSDTLGAYSSHLLHLIGCNLFNGFNISFSPPTTPIEILKFLPEFFIEIIPPCTLALLDFSRESILSNTDNLQIIVCMCSIFMGTSDFVRNPHLRAKLVECLGLLCNYEKQDSSHSRNIYKINIFNCIKSFPFLPKLLVKNLMQLFIDIEFTGETNSFYQKFNYRRTMYMLLEYLWEIEEINDIFKEFSNEAVASELRDEIPIFLRFINLLVNDASFLLEEAFLLLPKIQIMEREMDDVMTWSSQPEDVRNQKEEQYEKDRKQASAYNTLSLQTVEILKLITNDIKKIFVWSVLEDRIACTLNFFLSSLVGSEKKKELKVKNMQELNFEPKKLLIAICNIYSNLSDEEKFPQAIIRDSRSFNISLFDEARSVLSQICCPSGVIMAMIKLKRKFIKLLDEQKSETNSDDVEIPDEFLDPISYAIMDDPVILPSSKITIDRPIITKHLLSYNHDPFNREHLTLDMLIPNVELKKRIDEWKANRKNKQK